MASKAVGLHHQPDDGRILLRLLNERARLRHHRHAWQRLALLGVELVGDVHKLQPLEEIHLTHFAAVEDNGTGREEAARLRSTRLAGREQQSMETRITEQKIEILRTRNGIATALSADGLRDE